MLRQIHTPPSPPYVNRRRRNGPNSQYVNRSGLVLLKERGSQKNAAPTDGDCGGKLHRVTKHNHPIGWAAANERPTLGKFVLQPIDPPASSPPAPIQPPTSPHTLVSDQMCAFRAPSMQNLNFHLTDDSGECRVKDALLNPTFQSSAGDSEGGPT